MTSEREQQLEEALRNLVAQIELSTDCMSGMIDAEDLQDFVEEAEELLGSTEATPPGACTIEERP